MHSRDILAEMFSRSTPYVQKVKVNWMLDCLQVVPGSSSCKTTACYCTHLSIGDSTAPFLQHFQLVHPLGPHHRFRSSKGSNAIHFILGGKFNN